MKIMKQIIILLAIIFLTRLFTSCSKLPPQILADISLKFNRCRIRCYSIPDLKLLPLYRCDIPTDEMARNYPLEKCDGIAGFYLESWAKEIIPHAKKAKAYYEDACK